MVLLASLLVAHAASAESWLDRVLQFSGIAASPGAMKGDSDAPPAGDVWITDHAGGGVRRLTRDHGYRWPVFMPGDGALLALREEQLVRIPVDGEAPSPLFQVAGIRKLIGFDRQDPYSVLVLTVDRGRPMQVLSLNRKSSEPLPYDAQDPSQRRLLRHREGQERGYGNVRVYVREESREDLEGVRKWTDVYMSRADAAPRRITACEGNDCGQPSLSPSGGLVAYVRN